MSLPILTTNEPLTVTLFANRTNFFVRLSAAPSLNDERWVVSGDPDRQSVRVHVHNRWDYWNCEHQQYRLHRVEIVSNIRHPRSLTIVLPSYVSSVTFRRSRFFVCDCEARFRQRSTTERTRRLRQRQRRRERRGEGISVEDGHEGFVDDDTWADYDWEA